MPEFTRASAQAPADAGYITMHFGDITEIEAVNRDDLGRIIIQFSTSTGNYVSLAFSPKMNDKLLQLSLACVGPTPSLKMPPKTTAEKLDAAAAVDDNGEAFGAALNGFIGALGRAK
jgi:hypothetical protein